MTRKTGKADKWFDEDNNEWKDTDEDGNKQWDTDGDGIPDAKDTDGDKNADKWKDPDTEQWKGENGKDENGGKDTNGDGKIDTWYDEKGNETAKDTDGDGKADKWVDPETGKYPDEEEPEKYPKAKDTNGDGKPDTWVDEKGNEVAKDTDGDGKADKFVDPETGKFPDPNAPEKYPKPLDKNGDGIPDTWVDEEGNEVARDTDEDGKADQWKDPSAPDSDWKNEDENNHKQWDTNGDGLPDAKDTDGDDKADKWVDPNEPDGEWKDAQGSGKGNGKDENGDGKVDAWDTDGNGQNDAWDTDGDGKADSFDKDGDGQLDDEEDASKHPELNGRDENGGKDTNGDGKPDTWDTNKDGKDDSWDTDGDGNADSYDKNGNGELDDNENSSKHPNENNNGKDENGGKDTNGDGKPDTWYDENGRVVGKDEDGDGKADKFIDPETQDPNGNGELSDKDRNKNKLFDTDGDGKPDARDTNNDGNADEWKDPETGEWKSSDELPGKPQDKDGDGIPDEWDFNNDGRPDAWDTNKDGKPDQWDTNNDTKVDAWDTDGDGLPDSYDTTNDGSADTWVPSAKEGTIEFSYDPNTWTKGEVTVTLSSTYTNNGFTIQYSTNYDELQRTGDWKDGTTVTLKDNGSIYARLKSTKNEDIGGIIKGEVNKIDKVAPTVTVNTLEQTTSTIKVQTEVEDKASGLPETVEYNYYIKERNKPNGEYELVDTRTEQRRPDIKTSTNTYTFKKLVQTTDYDIKVEVADAVGNVGNAETKGKTGEVPGGKANITLNNLQWHPEEHKATAQVSTEQTNYQIRYWTRHEEKDTEHIVIGNKETITVRENNTTIFAELWDETNASKTAVSLEIKDDKGPRITIPTVTSTTKEITVKASAEDNEFGMKDSPQYNFYIKKTGDESYPSEPEEKSADGNCTFKNKDQSTQYSIMVKIVDYMDNSSSKEATITTQTMPDANNEENGIEFGNEQWSDRKATVTVTKKKENDGYTIQYRIGNAAGASWIEIQNGEALPPQSHGTDVYARLWDGRNPGKEKKKTITDATKPTVKTAKQETEIWKNVNKSIIVTASDNESGIVAYAITQGTTAPGKDSNDWKQHTESTWTSEAYDNGTYYAWVKDGAGNISETGVTVEVNNIEREKPTIAVSTNTSPLQSQRAMVTITDKGGSHLKEKSYTINYEWSTSANKPDKLTQTETITVGAGQDIGAVGISKSGVTGTYYLYIQGVNIEDNAGNSNSPETMGTFEFDNSPPTINITPANGNTNWEKSKNATITVSENGKASANPESYMYVWQHGSIQPTAEGNYNQKYTSGTPVTLTNQTGSDWYIAAIAKDSLGNTAKAIAGPFYIDNTAPNTQKPTLVSTTNSITATFAQTDANSQINGTTRKYYYKEKTANNWTEWPAGNGQATATITNLKLNLKYEVKTSVQDNAGNGYTDSVSAEIDTKNILKPQFSISPAASQGYTNGEVTVTITYPTTGSGLTNQYRIGTTDAWKNYTVPFKVGSNCTIYAHTIDSTGQGDDPTRQVSLQITNIDTTKPTVKSAIVVDGDKWTTGNKKITVTAEDTGGSGIAAYAITPGANAPAVTASEWNTNETTSWTSVAYGPGTYYAWVKDKANNVSVSKTVTVEKIDTTPPTVTSAIQTPAGWTNSNKAITINASDGSGSGISAYAITNSHEAPAAYEWTPSNQTSWTSANVYEAGTYYAWVKDKVGHVSAAGLSVNVGFIDETQPTISVTGNTSNVERTKTATITISDQNSGFAAQTYTVSYEWTTSSSPSTTYSKKATISASAGAGSVSTTVELKDATGEYYLHVRGENLKDQAGNTYSPTSIGGPFKVDNKGPKITFGTTESRVYSQTKNSIIKVEQDGPAGADTNSQKYVWLQNSTAPGSDSDYKTAYVNGETASISSKTGQNWYLAAMAKDSLGNTTRVITGPFWLDNNPPNTSAPGASSTTTTITVSSKQSDTESGLNNSTRQYSYRKAGTSNWNQWILSTGESYTFSNLESDTSYEVKTQIKDAVGNGPAESQITTIKTKAISTPSLVSSASNTSWTNQDVTVTITYTETAGLVMEYSTDGRNWTKTTENPKRVTVQNKGTTVYGRLRNESSGQEKTQSITINNIDKTLPGGTISFSPSTVQKGAKVNATVTLTDEGGSTVNTSSCRWEFNTNSGEIGKSAGSYSGGSFTSTTQIIPLTPQIRGDYYLHVLVVDGAGNNSEIISVKLTVVEQLYSITFDKNGGSGQVPATAYYAEGETVTIDTSKTPTRSGYTFAGWTQTQGSVSGLVRNSSYSPFKMPNKSITLYALYSCSNYDKGTWCAGGKENYLPCYGTMNYMELVWNSETDWYMRCTYCTRISDSYGDVCYHPCGHGKSGYHTYGGYTCKHGEYKGHYYDSTPCPHGKTSTHYV